MDAKQFLAEFGHIANAPNGVQRLRDLVLAFAIQGKLVKQKSQEECAQQQLDEIAKISSHVLGKLVRANRLIKSDASHLRDTLPDGWASAPLGDLVRVLNGRAYKKQELLGAGTPVLRVGNLFTSNQWYYSDLKLEEDKYCDDGDLLYAWSASFGPFIWSGGKVIYHYHIWKLDFFSEALLNKKYLYTFLLEKTNEIKASGHGIAMAHMTKAEMETLEVPLPPLEEQSRIVAKVDELMALCDKLEAQQQKKRQLQNKLRQSVLQAVANAESPKELQDSWERLAGNFSHLFAEAVDVADFKGMILDIAVSGQLLKYDAIQTTGEGLLSQIEEERLKWAAASKDQELKEAQAMIKKLKKQKVTFPEASLPKHWAWATFLHVSQAVVDCHNKTAPYVNNGIHLVRTTDIRDGKMDLHNTKKITEETYAYWSRRMPPQAGDIFFTREAPMGEVAIVPEGEKVCLGQRTMLIRLFPNLFNNQFLTYVIQSPSFQKRMVEAAIGMTVKHLRVGGVEDLIVPVPPKHEQDKLVELIRDLFKKCDYFQNQLQRERRISANLAAAAIASLTGISTPQQEEPMKVPKTELKAPVRLGTAQPPNNMQAPLASLLARHNGEMGANDLWQRFGGEVDAFYAQLKTEVMHGWVAEPTGAQMLEKEAD